MARRRRIGKAHPRLFKYLTIFGATLGIVSGTAFSVCMGIDAVKGDIITDELREYEVSFSSEGSLIAKNVYKRGEQFTPPENPTHSLDGENNYFFIGWDTNGNGIPDFVPPRAYYSFNAEAVYFRTGKFDMSLLDLLNMSPEDLMKLLQDLNIDWEQFMSMFNISLEDLLEFLKGTSILTYETVPGNSSFPVYFRSTSFGDFDYSKMAFNAPSFYDSNNISNNSINPLSFTSYKLQKLEEMGMLPDGFGFTEYDISYNCTQDYYPIPDCSYGDDLNELSNSDAHYEVQPVDNQLVANSAYCPAFGYVIDLFKMIPLSGTVARDEKAYYQYALQNYTSVPEQYYEVLDDMIYDPNNNWYEDTNGNELWQVDSIAAYVSKLGTCNVFGEDGGLDIASLAGNNKATFDPINTLLSKHEGSPYDFNTTATLLFRRLNIPARLVKGYVGFPGSPLGNTITLYNEHYWCEIYVAGTGWMICDCIDPSAITGENPYEQLDKSNTPLQNNHILERITVQAPNKTEYFIGEPLDITGGSLTAYFSDDTHTTMRLNAPGVTLSGFDSSTKGVYNVKVTYSYEGVDKSANFAVTIKEKDAEMINVFFDFTAVKKEFFLDDEFTYSGIVATAYYDDGTSTNVSNSVKIAGETETFTSEIRTDYEVVAFVTNKDNTQTFSDSYYITVMEDTPEELTIISPPTKTQYFTGEKLDVTGLSFTVRYKSNKLQSFNPTGKADTVEPEIAEFSITKFDTANANQEVVVSKWNMDYTKRAYASFEVEVLQNNVESYEYYGFKNDYSVGDYFDADTFKAGGWLVINFVNGDSVKVVQSYAADANYDYVHATSFNIQAPALHTAALDGSSKAIVSFAYENVNYDVEVPVTVKNVDTTEFIFSEPSKVTTAGPGSGVISDEQLFTFNTDYVGTMYFRNMSYNTYSPKGWTNSTNTSLTYSPNGFTYNKAAQVYNSYQVNINYVNDFAHGVLPIYANSAGQDNYENAGSVQDGDNASFQFTNFPLTGDNLTRLSNNTYLPYTNNLSTSATSYQNQQLSKYRMTGSSDGSQAYYLIEDYISQAGHQYNTYNTANIDQKVSLVNKVKSDLASEFTYDINFKYTNADTDPLVSFFNDKTGISSTFASAATLIFRHLGLEARYVVGFGAYSDGHSNTMVTAKNAHAWCEVYFNNVGWITVDPTGLDTGMIRSGTGDYGDGFGGSGITDFSKILYGGNIVVSYDYSKDSSFEEDTAVSANDPARWYLTYDGKDHHKIFSDSFDNTSGTLPSFLKYELYFEWYRNGVSYGEYSANDTATTSYGQYELVPKIRIIDRITGEDVTAEYNYTLAPGTTSLQYYVQSALVYVYVYGLKDSYSMNGNPSIYLYTGANGDIYFKLDVPQDIADLGLYDELPEGLTVSIDGYFYYEGEGGTIVITYDNINVYISGTSTLDWDPDNVYLIPYFGEVIINP